jgi:hypothetical protein
MNDIKKSWMDVIHPLVNIKHPWMNSSIHPSWSNYIHTKGCREGVCECMQKSWKTIWKIQAKKESLNFSTIVNHLIISMFFELLQ